MYNILVITKYDFIYNLKALEKSYRNPPAAGLKINAENSGIGKT